jgi:hypothetical protein
MMRGVAFRLQHGTSRTHYVFIHDMKWLPFVVLLLLAEASGLRAQQQFPMLRAHHRLQPSRLVAPRKMSILGSPDSTTTSHFPNIDVTNDPLDDQNEPSLSVNPIDPLAIAIGEVDDRNFDVLWYCATTNGGATWNNDSLPQGYFDGGSVAFDNATDPGVVFDQTGTLFFSNVFYQFPAPNNEEACYKSTDNGLSWQVPVYVGGDTTGIESEADRDYITVDRDSTSPYFGRIYIVWVTIAFPTSIIVEAHSTDHGASWSLPVTVSSAPITQDTILFQGPIPACGPNGELFIVFEDRDSLSKRILVARSTDGGISFEPQVEVSPYHELGPVVPDNFDGHPEIKGSVETNSFPSIAVDRSNLHKGQIYVTWCGRDADSSAHVYLSISDDAAQTWTTPDTIEDDTSAIRTDKFLPWIAVDQSSGDVGVTFYDSRNDPDSNILVDDYLTLSTDGGQTFTARRISSVSSDPRVCRDVVTVDGTDLLFFGDYISLDAMDSNWYPAWTDTRSGFDQDIYMSIVPTDSFFKATSGVAMQIQNNNSIRFTNEPAIAGREDAMFVDCNQACSVSLTFYDELGRKIGTPISDGIVSSQHEIPFTPNMPGVQFFVLKELSSSATNQIVGKISVIDP